MVIGKALLAAGILCFAGLGMAAAGISAYPDRPVRFIVGYEPGGNTDAIARILARKLSDKWGQPVVVENRPGADGTIAAEAVTHAAPDGYTIDVITTNHTVTPTRLKLGYDAVKDFEPISLLVINPFLLVVNPALSAHSVKELVVLAKAKPGGLDFSSGGTSSPTFLAMAALMKRTGIKLNNITYRGTGPAMVALMGGEVQLAFGSVTGSRANAESGKLRALAVSTGERVRIMPDMPTIAESGDLPGFDEGAWVGALAPPGTPKPIVRRIRDDMVEALKLDDVQEILVQTANIMIASTPEEFTAFLNKDIAKWADLLKSFE